MKCSKEDTNVACKAIFYLGVLRGSIEDMLQLCKLIERTEAVVDITTEVAWVFNNHKNFTTKTVSRAILESSFKADFEGALDTINADPSAGMVDHDHLFFFKEDEVHQYDL